MHKNDRIRRRSNVDGRFQSNNGDGTSFTFLAGILQQGGTYFAEDGKHFNFDTPEARKIIQLMVDLAQKDKWSIQCSSMTPQMQSLPLSSLAISPSVYWFLGGGEGKIEFPDMKLITSRSHHT